MIATRHGSVIVSLSAVEFVNVDRFINMINIRFNREYVRHRLFFKMYIMNIHTTTERSHTQIASDEQTCDVSQ